jgi:signal peptidase I
VSLRRALLVGLVVVLGLGAGLAAKASGLHPVRITSGSMIPTVHVNEWVLITDATTAGRGEIVEFRYPTGSTGRAIKRVLAVGGDVVELTDDSIIVNGIAHPLAGEPVPFDRKTITVPDGYLYLLGDNHAGSYDSRGFGPIPMSDVVGHVRTTIPSPGTLALWAVGLAVVLFAGPVLFRWIRSRLGRSSPESTPSVQEPTDQRDGPGSETSTD